MRLYVVGDGNHKIAHYYAIDAEQARFMYAKDFDADKDSVEAEIVFANNKDSRLRGMVVAEVGGELI